MPITINLNDRIYCTLTPAGKARASAALGGRVDILHRDGIKLWELLGAFGCDQMFNGGTPLIDTNSFEWRGVDRGRPPRPLAADLIACLNALRKTSTDPVACALAQRLVAELSISHVDGE